MIPVRIYLKYLIESILIASICICHNPLFASPLDSVEEVQKYIADLHSENVLERAYAAHKLAGMGEKAHYAIPYLIAHLGDRGLDKEIWNVLEEHTSPAEESAKALIEMGIMAMEPIIIMLERMPSDPYVRYMGLRVLGQLNLGNDERMLIISFLNDESELVRKEAVRIIGRKKIGEAFSALTYKLDDTFEIVELTAWALSEIGDRRAIPYLIDSLDNRNTTYAQESIIKALEMLSNQSFGYEKKQWQEWWDKNKGPIIMHVMNDDQKIYLGVPFLFNVQCENVSDNYIIIRDIQIKGQIKDATEWYGSIWGRTEYQPVTDLWIHDRSSHMESEQIVAFKIIAPHQKFVFKKWVALQSDIVHINVAYNSLSAGDVKEHVYIRTGSPLSKPYLNHFERVESNAVINESIKYDYAFLPRIDVFSLQNSSLGLSVKTHGVPDIIETAEFRIKEDVSEYVYWETEEAWVVKGQTQAYYISNAQTIPLGKMDPFVIVVAAQYFPLIDVLVHKGLPREDLLQNRGLADFNDAYEVFSLRVDKLLEFAQEIKDKDYALSVVPISDKLQYRYYIKLSKKSN